jgi:uncharacterized damage-inducible protein DinB
MPAPRARVHPETVPSRVILISERLNQLLIEQLEPALWTALPFGRVRTIAAIFTHIHNVRCKWIRLTAPHLTAPAQLHRAYCSREQASLALAESGLLCAQMVDEAIGARAGKIETFHRDGWSSAWPVGLEMLCYMTTHEAHHRGQICMLAHQLGSPLSEKTTSRLWSWEKLGGDPGAPP